VTEQRQIDFDTLSAAIEDIEKSIEQQRNGTSLPPETTFIWDQGNWCEETGCGTALCYAGFMAVRLGADLPPLVPGVVGILPPYHRYWQVTDEGRWSDNDDDSIQIKYWVMDRVGLTEEQADALFQSGNSLANIKAMRDELVRNPNATYDELEEAAW